MKTNPPTSTKEIGILRIHAGMV
uniref:Uncharacterized protein n=1 Tax=Arundo donax TaxID=35708 RepID=A0A0A8ZXR8_ARUDO